MTNISAKRINQNTTLKTNIQLWQAIHFGIQNSQLVE